MRPALRVLAWLVTGLVALLIAIVLIGFRYAYEPSPSNVLSRYRASPEPWDLWGKPLSEQDAARLKVLAKNGGVHVNAATLRLGRRSFYRETFKNEVFLTDVMGIIDGPLRLTNVAKAVLALGGKGTTNLRVEVPATVKIGGRTFAKGSYFDTGLDVARGAFAPLGMAISVKAGKVRVGITCAACHARVDSETGKVIEGAPNQDLNAGLLLALATNSAAYFMHTDVHPLTAVPADPQHRVLSSSGEREPLPNIAVLEHKVDEALLMWPRGNFDSLTDMEADPTQNPVSFTWQNHPYGWSGNFVAGPFRGLSAQNNNVHALNSDSLLLAGSSRALFDIDRQVFLGILLQNAANPKYRYDLQSGQWPSDFLAARDPTPGSPGINQVVLPASYPKGTLITPDGTLTSAPGYKVWQQNNAMSAWQDTIVPPRSRVVVDEAASHLGREVFGRAHCDTCHAGEFLTNHRIIPAAELGVNPVRAKALKKTELNFAPPVIYGFDTPVPVPRGARSLAVPVAALDQSQIDLGWAHNGSDGGYKVASLVGLYWSAPYLHDGGVSVGRNAEVELGLPGTVEKNVMPDPGNSLRAVVDRGLRGRVVAANQASPALVRMNVSGVGHEYWIDAEAGFSAKEQDAVIAFLLGYEVR